MEHHPFTQIWPLLNLEDFEKFKQDIAANGQRLPILTYKGMVIDGRNREVACKKLGIEPRYEDSGAQSESDALGLVVSLNEHRRHLSEDQRASAADKLANIIHGHNQHVEKIEDISQEISSKINEGGKHAMSMLTAARAMNVAPMRVARIRGIRKHGGQAAVDEVIAGKIPLTTQYEKIMRQSSDKAKPSRLRKIIPTPAREFARMPTFTPQEVDPEFTGTPTEFTDKYGHVQVMTAEQYATTRYSDWALAMRSLAKYAKSMPGLPEVDHNWLRSPKARDVGWMIEALNVLRPLMAEAEALLERATALQKEPA